MNTFKIIVPIFMLTALVGCNKTDHASTAPAAATNTTATTTTTTNNGNANNSNMTASQHKDARESIMKQWGKASKAMGAMIKDPSKFDAAQFNLQAAKLNQDPWGHFGPGTKGGESKDNIWQDTAGFQQEIDKYKRAAADLNTAAQSATSVDQVKTQYAAVGASCKSCHQKFKED